MKKTYSQVIKQIESLQQEADKLRRQEIEGVVTRIREAIDHYKLTAADLGLAPAAGQRAAKTPGKPAVRKSGRKSAKVRAATARTAKYKDDQGRTWGGIGKRPQWLRDALAAGKTLQDFAVQ